MIRPAFVFLPALLFCLLFGVQPAAAQSRHAAFLDPASSSSQKSDGKSGPQANVLAADPPQTDAGETLVNVARRITVFFYNGFRTPVQLTQLMINADGNVRSKVLTDDCKSIKSLPAQDRCSIVMEVTPSSPGPWSVELLMNHTGQGRIARAEITGTTLGKTDEKAEGLAVSKKIAAPLEFGTIHAGEETAARTMLIENDSPEVLKVSSVDLIAEPTQGLSLRPSGCAKDDELKPGESCPITVMWEPRQRGNIATDLIVRHSGSLGFVVVPIRGSAQEREDKDGGGGGSSGGGGGGTRTSSLLPQGSGETRASLPMVSGTTVIPPATSAPILAPMPSIEQIAKSLPLLNSKSLKSSPKPKPAENDETALTVIPVVNLMGTVNGKAILSDRANQTYVVALGETVMIEEQPVEVVQIDSTRAVVKMAGIRKELSLSQVPSVVRNKGSSSSSSSGLGDSSTPSGASNNNPPKPTDPGATAPMPTVQTSPPAIPAPPAIPSSTGPGSGISPATDNSAGLGGGYAGSH